MGGVTAVFGDANTRPAMGLSGIVNPDVRKRFAYRRNVAIRELHDEADTKATAGIAAATPGARTRLDYTPATRRTRPRTRLRRPARLGELAVVSTWRAGLERRRDSIQGDPFMRIRMISSRGGRVRIARGVRALTALHLVVTFFSFAGAGPAAAQGTYYADLNAAVTDLTGRLVENDRLAGKRVLVNAHDFFEEGTRRNLPLSATLRERFGTELSTRRGVAVFALPQGSEDDMVILQGVWRDVSEPGAGAGTREIHLTVKLVERTSEGHRVLSSQDGRVERIDARLLTPDLASWGRHVVRKLEDQVRQRRRRIVRIGEVVMDGVPEPDRARRYLVRRWLIPAFAHSRLFGLATGGGEQSEGRLEVVVFMDSEQVEIVVDIRDGAGGPIGAATVDMVKGVFPARYFPSPEARPAVTGSGEGDDEAPPPPPPSDEVTALLAECAAHFGASRLTRPRGRNAAECYAQVLERERGNEEALAGLERIEARYVESAKGAIRQGELAKARGHVERLGELSPEHPGVAELEGEIAGAERKAEERRAVAEAEAKRKREEEARRKTEAERRRAEERRIAELTPEMVRIEGGCFRMGSPESETPRSSDERQHEVCVEAFSMGKYEVTFAEYDRFVEATGRSRPGDEGWGRGRRPVINVIWDDITAYAHWLSEETGRRYRLPTEAEWEYAARAGTQTSRYWGDDPSMACTYANVGDRTYREKYPDNDWAKHACRDGSVHTAPVGGYRANGYGLHDMLGNVWEWTCSEYHGGYGDYSGAEQRCASGSADERVLRGGNWFSGLWGARAAYRLGDIGNWGYGLGFRLAQD